MEFYESLHRYCISKGLYTAEMGVTNEIPLFIDILHYSDVIMGAMASQITSLTIIYSIVYSGADQGKHQSSE